MNINFTSLLLLNPQGQKRHITTLLKDFQDGHGDHGDHGTKKKSFLQDVLNDHNITSIQMVKSGLKWALIGFFYGIYQTAVRKADKHVLVTRNDWQPYYFFTRHKSYVLIGFIGGASWYFLYHQLICPHQTANLTRHITAYAIAGAAIGLTFYGPSRFVIGTVYGSLFGLFNAEKQKFRYKNSMFNHNENNPKIFTSGFELQLPKFDPKQRARVKRDEQQLLLSQSLRRNQQSMKLRHYVV